MSTGPSGYSFFIPTGDPPDSTPCALLPTQLEAVSPYICKVKAKGRHMNVLLVFHLDGPCLIHHNFDEL